ncbi:MAG: lipocalin-like domain-containing protein [Bryobacteraceae bacterium]
MKPATEIAHTPKFPGTWRLLSAEYVGPSGATRRLYGAGAVGMLIYDGKGHMSAQIANPEREPWAKGDRLAETPEEAKASIDSYISYFGDYTVDEKKSVVIHKVKSALIPNWTGTDQVREFEFWGDDRLILTTDAKIDGVVYKAKLTWERMQ